MKIPKSVNICGVEYTIVYKNRIVLKGLVCDGLCDSSKRQIQINAYVPKDRKFQIFLHECFHAVLYECGITMLNDDIEECVVDALSKWVDNSYTMRKKVAK